ncbi:MAG: phosphoglycerate kinase [Candidatus Rokubacteria bacterium GWC2_70_16]|nr:MAG: phosphoglycerate kinase [Candidatus Rokubacteria bacterium GWC2_70_16]OGL18640.1 MAG: phosphoglycerate kinase [Candidatus Rokubacteria bacterium RIFCSPLOWO2_12_FULL_71_19]
MPKLSVEQLDLAGKRVFLRVDFNVPLKDGRVSDDTRIAAALPTLQHCLRAGAGVVLASHLGRPKGKPDPAYSLRPVATRLAELLGQPVALAPDCVGPETEALARALGPRQVLLLENLRFHAEEEADDEAFARGLAALADVYVDDAFAAAHRAHASIEAITRYLSPAAAGLLMSRELAALGRIFEKPERPVVALLGGAKVSDKLALVQSLLDRVDGLLIGGGMAFTFLASLGHGVGRSLLEPDRIEAARAALDHGRTRGVKVRLPVDVVAAPGIDSRDDIRTVGIREIPADMMGLDIGPATVARFREALKGAATVLWNGPMGVFEREPFAAGTVEVGRAVAACGAFSVIGGGDTIAAAQAAGVTEQIGYISTAGGAFLEFLEGRVLPGVAALSDAA